MKPIKRDIEKEAEIEKRWKDRVDRNVQKIRRLDREVQQIKRRIEAWDREEQVIKRQKSEREERKAGKDIRERVEIEERELEFKSS